MLYYYLYLKCFLSFLNSHLKDYYYNGSNNETNSEK